MKLLTVVASVFIPLSFIVGLYGMNFDPELSSVNMPELKWKYGYIYAISLMVSVVVLALGGLGFLKRALQRSRCRRFRNSKRILSDQNPD
jgi:magnesium transporter